MTTTWYSNANRVAAHRADLEADARRHRATKPRRRIWRRRGNAATIPHHH
jgi:hypothetical protein